MNKATEPQFIKMMSTLQIKFTLDAVFMVASDVVELLGITPRQLSYWANKGLSLTKKKTEYHAWRRFSILDLFGYAVLKRLRELGFKISQCGMIFDCLRSHIYESPFAFFDYLALGYPILLYIDTINNDVHLLYGSDSIQAYVPAQPKDATPKIILPLTPLLKGVLTRVNKEGLELKFVKDKFGGENKIIFYIGEQRIDIEEDMRRLGESRAIQNGNKNDKNQN